MPRPSFHLDCALHQNHVSDIKLFQNRVVNNPGVIHLLFDNLHNLQNLLYHPQTTLIINSYTEDQYFIKIC